MPRKKKMVRVIQVSLYWKEDEIVQKMEESGDPVPETIRRLIREHGERVYPQEKSYAQALLLREQRKQEQAKSEQSFLKMTPEEYTTKVLRGKVKDGKAAFRVGNGQEIYLDLDTIKNETIESNEVIQIHNQLLDRTFTYVNGKKPTEKEYAGIWKGW